MTSSLRVRPGRKSVQVVAQQKKINNPYKGPWSPVEEAAKQLFVPDPITFATGEKWLDRQLYPKQATALKCIFLRDDLFTDFDYETIAEWEQNFRDSGDNGTPPGVIERIQILKFRRVEAIAKYGYFDERGWFRELVLVLGRRAGKGYVCAIAFAYVLYRYMSAWNPQAKYNIDRDKQMQCLIYAGRKEQARDNLWRDIVNVIQGAPCFSGYISKAMGESLTVNSPADWLARRADIFAGVTQSLDQASFRIVPLPATPGSGRGGASFSVGFDEMAHMISTGANRSSDEVWLAATPSLDQFSIDAFIMCPSSPWEMVGQFYKEWQKSQQMEDVYDEVNDVYTGEKQLAYPDIFMLQLASWEIYEGWELTRNDNTPEHPGLDLFPNDVVCTKCVDHDKKPKDHLWRGDLGEYENTKMPQFAELYRPVQAYDQKLKSDEKADPEGFAVERRSKWQATVNAYLDKNKILEMFKPIVDENGELAELQMVTRGALGTYYKAHGDPGFVNDNFGFAIAHTVTDAQGYLHVVFDYLHEWAPTDFEENIVDLEIVTDDIWDLVRDFPISDLSFDQHQSMHFFSVLNRRAREQHLPKLPQIHIINETAPYNLKVAQTFKVALNQGWIHAPYSETAELQLKFLKFENGKVTHQTAGPVQHDDLARAMFEVVFHHLERQVSVHLMEGVDISATMPQGNTPWMHPSSGAEKATIADLRNAVRKQGNAPAASAARGNNASRQRHQSGFGGFGRGPFPRGRGRGR